MNSWRTSRKADNRWFVGVQCEFCNTPILFGLDPSGGDGPINPSVRLVLTCPEPECSRQADYSGAPVSRFQKSDADPVVLKAKVTV